jgi:biopolymer transport protein ExbB
MLSHLFLGISLIGAEWVLYLLVLLSVLSLTLIFERALFYRAASKGLLIFRQDIRKQIARGETLEAARLATLRKATGLTTPDLETEMVLAVASHPKKDPTVLSELAQDSVIRARIEWEKNLSILATIGANAPFIGLFGTVLGIIKAFHDLSQQAGTGAQTVSSGISEALVATAIGLLVAIPAVVAFNIFQRKVKSALGEAEALKSFLIGKLGQ